MFDRSSMLSASNSATPALRRMVEHSPLGLFPLYQRTQITVAASAYSDVFLIIAGVTAVGALLALMLKVPSPADCSPDDEVSGESRPSRQIGH